LKYLDIDLADYFHIYRVYHGVIERDLRYHDIRRKKGLFYLMRTGGFIEIAGLDLQADGGTHVANTSEVGAIRVVDYKSKGKINKRIVVAVE
ncbi:MAG: hypothetical protein ACE5FI_13965, partial [Anaerolineales bacterium]